MNKKPKQLYFIAIGKLLDAGFHERYDGNGEPETKIWIEAVSQWLNQFTEFDSMEEAVYVSAFIGRLQKELTIIQSISVASEAKP
jgi:hypothetical protein